jgi:hypothetical protein
MIKLKITDREVVRPMQWGTNEESNTVIKCSVLYKAHRKLVIHNSYILSYNGEKHLSRYLGPSRVDERPVFEILRQYDEIEEESNDYFEDIEKSCSTNKIILMLA